MKKNPLRPLDFLIFALTAFAAFYFLRQTLNDSGKKVLVDANGMRYEYSAGRNGVYSVQGAAGITTFEIKDGKVRIIDSACPGKNCVHQGFSSPLICLPNKVIITLENNGEFDAVAE